MTRDELLAALEVATGPDRELDVALCDAVGHFDWWDQIKGPRRLTRAEALAVDAFRYSASLDAALTLVPEGALLSVWHMEFGAGAKVLVPHSRDGFAGQSENKSEAATMPLALCIAALTARGAA